MHLYKTRCLQNCHCLHPCERHIIQRRNIFISIRDSSPSGKHVLPPLSVARTSYRSQKTTGLIASMVFYRSGGNSAWQPIYRLPLTRTKTLEAYRNHQETTILKSLALYTGKSCLRLYLIENFEKIWMLILDATSRKSHRYLVSE